MNPKPFVFTLSLLAIASASASEQGINFNRDIRPVLSSKCFECHGPDEAERKEDLRLDVPDGEMGTLTPREDYNIITPGEPEESDLWFRITSEYEDEVMPPADSHKVPLTEEEIAKITQWIEEGGEYQDFWAFEPIEAPSRPEIENADWARNFIDYYVVANLEGKELQPQPEADKRTLIRRVTFDLTGLPPSVEEICVFLNDESPQAYENLIDRLLKDKAYGEHMARYWADLVRLASTNGVHHDFYREFSTYRDWLIRAYNDNLPFDDFISYQLAGDLYENPTRDHLIASGFNRLHMIIDRGTALPEESLHKNVIDRVEAFGTAFLGLTVQCAQCHDHKYDPITQKDYYQMYAFFNNFGGASETVKKPERGLQPPFINLTTPKQDQELANFDGREQDLEIQRDAIERIQGLSDKWPKEFEKVTVPWISIGAENVSDGLGFKTTIALSEKPTSAMARFVGESDVELVVNGNYVGKARGLEKAAAAEVSELLQVGDNEILARTKGTDGFALHLGYRIGDRAGTLVSGPSWVARDSASSDWQAVQEVGAPEAAGEWTTNVTSVEVLDFEESLDLLAEERSKYLETVPGAMIMSERDPPRQAHMLIGGAYDAPDAPVDRGTPGFLPPPKKKGSMLTRKDLADWLLRPDHPLTARVSVNRLWQQFFGMGLVKTSEDFGAQGEWPSHPELLDKLAAEFIESGWDVKRMVRLMVSSSTYRQSSDASPEEFRNDPQNRLLARGSRYRMDAEMIRDQTLAVSGKLNREMYGPSVKPPQPPGLWEMVSMAAPFTYEADTGDDIYRRSLYTYWRRAIPPPQMTIMNAPSREFCVSRRERTNTSLQALLLMNEEEYFRAAKSAAVSVLREEDTEADRLRLAYEKVTSQLPAPERLDLMAGTLEEFRQLYESDRELAKSLTSDLELASNEDRAELASYAMVVHSLLNLELAKVKR